MTTKVEKSKKVIFPALKINLDPGMVWVNKKNRQLTIAAQKILKRIQNKLSRENTESSEIKFAANQMEIMILNATKIRLVALLELFR